MGMFFLATGLAFAQASCSVGEVEGPDSGQPGQPPGDPSNPSNPSNPAGNPGATPGEQPYDPNHPGQNPGTDPGQQPGGDPGTPGPSDGKNPFAGALYYVNPDFVAQVDTSSQNVSGASRALLEKGKNLPSAVWLDVAAKVPTITAHLTKALDQQKAAGKPVVTVFVVYDLPNRDCAANSSNGELTLADDGMNKYRAYIDQIAAQFARFDQQRIVAVVEPDSLPNMATNMGVKRCDEQTARAYKDGVAYALKKLSLPHVSLYLDAAHSGWLGWDNNRQKIAVIFNEVLAMAGGADKIRGFATNVANYTELSAPSNVPESFYQGNPCRDELTYAKKLGESLSAAGIRDKTFLIDTSRNGKGGIRNTWGNWCNIDDAGLGERPRADPVSGVDAYYYVKVPGESDGVSQQGAPRFDSMCLSDDSTRDAPQAGQWYHSFYLMLLKNANPAL